MSNKYLGMRRKTHEFIDLPMKEYIRIGCRFFKCESSAISSKSRTKDLVKARHAIWWALTYHSHWSYPQIARRMGQKDHTSVLHGARKIEVLRHEDLKLQWSLDLYLDELREKAAKQHPATPHLTNDDIERIVGWVVPIQPEHAE